MNSTLQNPSPDPAATWPRHGDEQLNRFGALKVKSAVEVDFDPEREVTVAIPVLVRLQSPGEPARNPRYGLRHDATAEVAAPENPITAALLKVARPCHDPLKRGRIDNQPGDPQISLLRSIQPGNSSRARSQARKNPLDRSLLPPSFRDLTTTRKIRRILIAVAGATVLAIGVAMIVLPGPAIVVIPASLALLAIEFAWARRWLRAANGFGKRKAGRLSGTKGSQNQKPTKQFTRIPTLGG